MRAVNRLASGQCGLIDDSKAGQWRLPNRNELLSLVDHQCDNPAVSDRLGTGCLNIDAAPVFFGIVLDPYRPYWSSTSSGLDFAFYVRFIDGVSSTYSKGYGFYYGWAVRGGQ